MRRKPSIAFKRRFYDWLSNSNDAKNSTVLTNEKYDQIKKCLQGKIAQDQDLKRGSQWRIYPGGSTPKYDWFPKWPKKFRQEFSE